MNAREKEQWILQCLQKAPLLTRKGLLELSGLARTTIYDVLIRLQLKNQVFRATHTRKEKRKWQGRNKVYWTIKPELS